MEDYDPELRASLFGHPSNAIAEETAFERPDHETFKVTLLPADSHAERFPLTLTRSQDPAAFIAVRRHLFQPTFDEATFLNLLTMVHLHEEAVAQLRSSSGSSTMDINTRYFLDKVIDHVMSDTLFEKKFDTILYDKISKEFPYDRAPRFSETHFVDQAFDARGPFSEGLGANQEDVEIRDTPAQTTSRRAPLPDEIKGLNFYEEIDEDFAIGIMSEPLPKQKDRYAAAEGIAPVTDAEDMEMADGPPDQSQLEYSPPLEEKTQVLEFSGIQERLKAETSPSPFFPLSPRSPSSEEVTTWGTLSPLLTDQPQRADTPSPRGLSPGLSPSPISGAHPFAGASQIKVSLPAEEPERVGRSLASMLPARTPSLDPPESASLVGTSPIPFTKESIGNLTPMVPSRESTPVNLSFGGFSPPPYQPGTQSPRGRVGR